MDIQDIVTKVKTALSDRRVQIGLALGVGLLVLLVLSRGGCANSASSSLSEPVQTEGVALTEAEALAGEVEAQEASESSPAALEGPEAQVTTVALPVAQEALESTQETPEAVYEEIASSPDAAE